MNFKDDIEEDRLLSKSVISSVNEWAEELKEDAGLESTMYEYNRSIVRKFIFMAVCLILIVIVSGIAITVGPYSIGFLESYEIVWNHIFGTPVDPLKDYIVTQLRMPRIVVGIIGGAGLAVCGAVMQSVLKNPLADPYTTGVSSGASFGATLIMTGKFGLSLGAGGVVTGAFIFSLVPTAIMIFISKLKNASPTTIIMAGIGVMYIFNAFTTVLMLWSDPNNLAKIYQWQVGSLETIEWYAVPLILSIVTIGIVSTQFLSSRLNVLATGDDSAKALGVDANRIRIICLIIVGLITAAVVSFTGLIGFIGLVTPHIVRMFIGADNRYLIPASAVFGGMLLVGADLVGRIVLSPVIIQVGVVMAFIGGPVFLWLIAKKNSNVWG